MSTTNIREVELKDNSALSALIKRVFIEFDAPRIGTVYSDPTTNDLFSLFQKEKSVLYVAEVGTEIAGLCGIYPTPGLDADCAEIVKFYLDAKYRGAGIGKKLFTKCLETARDLGYQSLYIESLPAFDKAIQMYRNFGFENINKPLGNSGHTSCNVWMTKKL